MSFLKHEPPNPMLGARNRGPMRLSMPTARDTSMTFAAVFSQSAEMALIERDALRKEGVGHEFGKLGAPHVAREDPLARNPVGVDLDDRLARP